jgi:hypothetical protein
MREKVDTLQVKTAVSGYGYISRISGRSITSQAIAPISCIDTIPVKKRFNLKKHPTDVGQNENEH